MSDVKVESQTSWAVVSTVDEPSMLVRAFARHHLAIGAQEVHIYLDRPNPVAQADLETLDGCFVTVCDEAYWQETNAGVRREWHTGRQKHNANQAYAKTKCGWLLHCDGDEFVESADDLLADLRVASKPWQFQRIPNIERVYGPDTTGNFLFEGLFRKANDNHAEQGQEIYGRFAKFLRRGLTGHAQGKGIVRTGGDVSMGIHQPMPLEDGTYPAYRRCRKARILHFDGLTPLHFAIKITRYAMRNYSGPKPSQGAHREAQIRYVRNNIGRPKELFRLVHGAQSLSQVQVDVLSILGHLEESAFQLQGCEGLDLSREAFDAELRILHADLIKEAGLAALT